MAQIKIAGLTDVEKVLPALRELRPHRTEDEIRKLFPLLYEQGYRIAYIGDDTAHALIGFRIVTTFFSGKTLIVDDLCTASAFRNRGFAGLLFSWIKEQARNLNCEYLCLNSGFHRKDAHRFYLNQGLHFESMHFGGKVNEV